MRNADLLITKEWPSPGRNPKAPVFERRRRRALRNVDRYRAELDVITRFIGSGRRVLDVACGTGFRVLELANRGFEALGLEIDPNLCTLANDAGRHFGIGATQVCGDACRIPFAAGSFDAVMSTAFFEHVYDVDLALCEQLRILRPGGVLIVEDGNVLDPFVLLDLLVAYPLRTKGQYGGLKWLFTKRRVRENLYGYLPRGRDEDQKTMWWWRRKFRRMPDVDVIEVATMGKYVATRTPRVFYPFRGPCLAVAAKRGSA